MVSSGPVEQIHRYFIAAGISENALDYTLGALLKARLVQPYDASIDDINSSERIAITHSGRMHFEMATVDPYFVSDMAFATPLRLMDVVEHLRQARSTKMDAQSWRAIQKSFVEYLLDQDAIFFRIPKEGIYDSQRLLREELKSRWIKHEAKPDPINDSENFSQKTATVIWFNLERGFGFAEAGLDKNVFLHRSILQQSGIEDLHEGDVIVCDIAPVPKGKLEAIAIHSVSTAASPGQRQSQDTVFIDGILDFWNPQKGYGFVKTHNLPEDTYISTKINLGQDANTLRQGARIRGLAARGRLGKLAMISVELIEDA